MEGYLDRASNRPVIELEVNYKKMPCLIDTGYTGFLATGKNIVEDLGLQLRPEVKQSELADMSRADFRTAVTQVFWFDRYRLMEVQVFLTRRVSPVPLILGVEALIGYILLVDFNHGRVSIRDPSMRTASP
jgi:predicted aspartyl protease